MPLINKAAVIFISQGLQRHLWYVAWQHKLVKSACSYQISKVLVPSHAVTKSESQWCCIPSSQGQEKGRGKPPSSCQPHHPPLPVPRIPAATPGPGGANAVQTCTFIQRVQEGMGSHTLRIAGELPSSLSCSFLLPTFHSLFPHFQFRWLS